MIKIKNKDYKFTVFPSSKGFWSIDHWLSKFLCFIQNFFVLLFLLFFPYFSLQF